MSIRCLVTGSAGFIGFHVSKALLEDGYEVIGMDNFYPYYSPVLKEERHKVLANYDKFIEAKIDISDLEALRRAFDLHKPEAIINLAAQAGVRYSLINPHVYQSSNLQGFINIIQLAREHKIKRLIYASSSSVYGNVKESPFHEEQNVDTPISLYAATKRANELIAHTYTHLYGLQTIGLRFFTVYGPWGRPDMAMWIFTDAISNGKSIQIYNHGKSYRDFTFIDDIVSGIKACLIKEDIDPYEIMNLGNNHSENIMEVVRILEECLGKKAVTEFLPLQPGDMVSTAANIQKAQEKLDFSPKTTISEGIPRFVSWYKSRPELMEEVRRFGFKR